jgi:hypothetical protein
MRTSFGPHPMTATAPGTPPTISIVKRTASTTSRPPRCSDAGGRFARSDPRVPEPTSSSPLPAARSRSARSWGDCCRTSLAVCDGPGPSTKRPRPAGSPTQQSRLGARIRPRMGGQSMIQLARTVLRRMGSELYVASRPVPSPDPSTNRPHSRGTAPPGTYLALTAGMNRKLGSRCHRRSAGSLATASARCRGSRIRSITKPALSNAIE